jgi:PTS system mannose-specific IIB component/fructoselysine and glucoselysine-specific PTS system IIB component
VTLDLVRLDDRLVHGQVVVGWGQALALQLIVLVDDHVRESDWEQELYRMGVPSEIELKFVSVGEAIDAVPGWAGSPRKILILTGNVGSLVRLVEGAPAIRQVNLGGLHQQNNRRQRLRYLFLSDSEMSQLQQLSERGIEITAQDVPTAAPIPLGEIR